MLKYTALFFCQTGVKCLNHELHCDFFCEIIRVSKPCGSLHIVLRHSVKGQYSIRSFFFAVFILRCTIRAIRTSEHLFLSAKYFHDLTVNLRYFAGDFYAHHALSVLRSPEVVVELDRGFRDSFHCLSFPLARSSGWTSLKKEPHDGEL